LDIAVITLPRESDSGELFSTENEATVPLINPAKGVGTGTRVAWAGFPAVVEDVLDRAQLCYFEGVVSAMVDNDERQLYIVDGHTTYGVSGEPVWHRSDETLQPEVVGIVSNYSHTNDNLPGFCSFEPVNPLFYYLSSWHVKLPGGYDNFVLFNVSKSRQESEA
jgi:hypothetical protein